MTSNSTSAGSAAGVLVMETGMACLSLELDAVDLWLCEIERGEDGGRRRIHLWQRA
jgi:hypothetical protein